MGNKLSRSRMAAAEFFKIANPEDEFFLVEFDDSPRLVVPLTSNTGRFRISLHFRDPTDPRRCSTRCTWRCTK